MAEHVVFLLDNDKDFLNLYSKLLQSKGCQVLQPTIFFCCLNMPKRFCRNGYLLMKILLPNTKKSWSKSLIKASPSTTHILPLWANAAAKPLPIQTKVLNLFTNQRFWKR